MIDEKKADKFWRKRSKITDDPRKSTHFKKDSTHVYDLRLIKKYANKKSRVLDLGCGTCFLSNRLVKHVQYIKAVDKHGGFLEFCNISSKLRVEESDLIKYKDNKKYDVILLFGVINYFSDKNEDKIYKLCSKLLAPNGILIVKHQCGVKEEVEINSYSKQIGDVYHSRYPYVKRELQNLKKYYKVKKIDIYPQKLNQWKNTHFYAFICNK